MKTSQIRLLYISGFMLAVLFVGACKRSPKPEEVTQAAPAPKPPSFDEKLQAELARLPEFVDRDLFKGLWTLSERCQVDTQASQVECKNEYYNNIVKLYQRGLKPRHEALQTISYIWQNENEKMKTAAADLMSRALGTAKGTVPPVKVIQKLIGQLQDLPEKQAIDATPTLTHVAAKAGIEDALYPIFESPGKERIAVTGYRHIMAEARMRVFDRIQRLAESSHNDLAVAAVEAPRAMGGLTPEENTQICNWMKGLSKSGRPLIETRAAAYLAGCGSKYVESLLADDEKRVAKSKPLSAGLDIYRDLCDSEKVNPHGNATKAQCARLQKLAKAVLTDQTASESDRMVALSMLAQQFPSKDTLALATKLASEDDTALSRKAEDTLRKLQRQSEDKKN